MNTSDRPTLCPLCKRPLGDVNVDEHHLIPKSSGGKYTDTVRLHRMCHQKIHATFSNKELKHEYNTIDLLLQHEDIRKFINWVAKKPPEFYQHNMFSNQRRRKGT